jgi:hypothetical protein
MFWPCTNHELDILISALKTAGAQYDTATLLAKAEKESSRRIEAGEHYHPTA